MTLRFLTAGESHGPALTAILEGLPAGLPLSAELIDGELKRRQQGYGSGARMKIEQDRAQILSGVMAGLTTGAPLAILIENRDHPRWKSRRIPPFSVPRPGHADLTGAVKYGYSDLRPALERASARETTARTAVGAVCKHFLAQFDVFIGGYVVSLGDVQAEIEGQSPRDLFLQAEASDVRCPDPAAAEKMRLAIRKVMEDRDTLGGVIEIAAVGLPVGLGSHVHWDRKLEARLAAAVMGVQAIKGVEIGPAFENTRLRGTQVQDAIRLDGDRLMRAGNRAGGLEGGITNGQPLILRAAMKPIATTLKPQQSVDLAAGQEVDTRYERSDFCPVPRATPILEAVVAYVLADALIEKLGGDSLQEMKGRFDKLRQPSLGDLKDEFGAQSDGQVFWP